MLRPERRDRYKEVSLARGDFLYFSEKLRTPSGHLIQFVPVLMYIVLDVLQGFLIARDQKIHLIEQALLKLHEVNRSQVRGIGSRKDTDERLSNIALSPLYICERLWHTHLQKNPIVPL